MTPAGLDFGDPVFLWLLLLIPLLALIRGRIGPAAAVIFSSVAIAAAVSRRRRYRAGAFLFGLKLLALAALILALARPRIGQGGQIIEADGLDIVLAVDVSLSMLGLDFTIENRRGTRLEAVKSVIAAFIDRRPHDRLSLVAFAGEPYLVSPLTLNHSWLRQNLERLQIGFVREQGTAIGSAIGMSVNRLRDLTNDSDGKIVVLLTDGKNNAGQISPLAAAEAATAFGIRVYAIAAGASDRVLVPRLGRDYEVMRNAAGEPIPQGYAEFPIDEDTLRQIADMTSGRFYRAADTERLKEIYHEIDQLERTTVELRQFDRYEEVYAWPLSTALIFFGLNQVLAHTRFRRLP